MKDLEIRGAGNLLGAEQHGHIAAVGFDTYLKLLAESIAEMKDADAVTEAHLRQSERDLAKYIQNPVAPKKSAAPPPIMAPI